MYEMLIKRYKAKKKVYTYNDKTIKCNDKTIGIQR